MYAETGYTVPSASFTGLSIYDRSVPATAVIVRQLLPNKEEIRISSPQRDRLSSQCEVDGDREAQDYTAPVPLAHSDQAYLTSHRSSAEPSNGPFPSHIITEQDNHPFTEITFPSPSHCNPLGSSVWRRLAAEYITIPLGLTSR